MKISLTCPASLPASQFGGIMFLCIHIARNLAEQGHDITIYTTDLDFANNAKTFNPHLPRIEIVNKFTINRSHAWFSFYLFFVNPGMYLQMSRQKHDVIHAVGARSFQALIAALISKRHHIPLIVSDQGGLTTHPDLQQGGLVKKILIKLQNQMVKFVIRQATKVIVANEYEKQIFTKFCNESKITIVRNGIDLDDLHVSSDNFKTKYNIKTNFILFVGRFNKVKGIDILLQAASSIKHILQESKTQLVVMGVDFGFESEMYRIIKDMKLDDVIKVIKNPPRVDVISAYAECEFLVLPSRWELSPLTPLEGFAFKKTVISTNTHGTPFTITNGENGVLVESENFRSLASAIVDLLSNRKKCTEYGLAGYRLVQQTCNAKTMAENTLNIYKQVINR
jgi:glycosyltransferase involved in cell wall biosynthesis